MPARKRQIPKGKPEKIVKPEKQGSGTDLNGADKKTSKKNKSTKGRRSRVLAPAIVALVVLLLVLLSVGIYAYNFVDADEFLGSNVGNTGTKDAEEEVNEKETQSANTDTKPHETNDVESVSDDEGPYKNAAITNDDDFKIKLQLDAADHFIEKGQYQVAKTKYEALLKEHPSSPRAQYGIAVALDKLSEVKQSNQLLEECIEAYSKVVDMPLDQTPKELVLMAGRRCAGRQSFRGWGWRGTRTTLKLISFYPEELHLWNELGVQYLLISRIDDARDAFQEVLKRDRSNGYAMVHLGFILKTSDNNPKEAIPLLQKGIDSGAPGVIDGRFFFHLGDAYYRSGKHEKAYDVFKKGAENGLFLSYWQRSLYNVDSLTARPWWTPKETTYEKHIKVLESNWKTIRDEGLSQLDVKKGSFIPEEENLREKGDWKQFTLYQQGRKFEQNCAKVPKTCALIESIHAAKTCSRGQVKFSVMQPGVHVWPHCGPTNCRIRAHLGLVVPDGLRIRVTNDTRTWTEGKMIIFDDSFEHEVWHEGSSFRLVLIVDFWHPELTDHQRRTLSPI